MKNEWIQKDTVKISRDESSGIASIINYDGESLFACPTKWPDEQIMEVVRIANEAYAYGFSAGSGDRVKMIRKALGL